MLYWSQIWYGLGMYLVYIKKMAIPSFYNLFFYI